MRTPVTSSVWSQSEMRGQVLPRTVASQVTPSQALELSEVTTVPETEVPLVESENMAEASMPPVLEREINRSYVSIRDTSVNLDESKYALVPATAVVTDENNTTHIGMLRFDEGDTRVISEGNARVNNKHKNQNLTYVTKIRLIRDGNRPNFISSSLPPSSCYLMRKWYHKHS